MDNNAYPGEIILEVTNRCNEACVMCHFHGEGAKKIRNIGDMKPDTWERVLDEIKDCGRKVQLITHGAGEPLIYADLFSLLKKASEIRNVKTGFMTNGMALTPDVSEKLLDTGVGFMAFSVDGVEPEPHAKYRRGSDLKRIESNIMELIRLKEKKGLKEPVLSFNMVGLPEIMHQEKAYVEKWLPYASNVMISKYRPVGSKKLFGKLPDPLPCPLIYRQMVITWDGRVALCCEDIHCEVQIGDVKKNSIKEIWNSRKMVEIRCLHENKGPSAFGFCSDCDTWAAHHVLGEEFLHGGVVKRETPAQIIYSKENI